MLRNKIISDSLTLKTHSFVFLLLAAFIFLLYGHTITHQYAIDDDLVTQNHTIVQKGIKGIPEIFTSYYFIDKKMQFGYRPVVVSSFAIEHQFYGQNPHVSHFINICLYIFNCFLLFIVLKKLFPKKNLLFSLAITLLFAAHPIHTEVVCSIKSRDELLSFLFSFLSLWLGLKYCESRKNLLHLPLILLFYILAIFSKQTAYTFLAIIPLSVYVLKGQFELKKQIPLILFLIIGVTIASLPRFLLPPIERELFYFENPLVSEGGFFNRIGVASYVIFFYIKLFIYPHPLVFYYGYNMVPLLKVYHPLALTVIVLSAIFFILAVLKIRKYPVTAFAVLYFFISISLFLNIVEPVAGVVAERFAYFSSLSFCILLVSFLTYILKVDTLKPARTKQFLFTTCVLIILVLYGIKTYSRSQDWKNHSVLYGRDMKYMQNSALGNAIYAELLINEIFNDISKGRQASNFEGKLKKAIKHYEQSITVYKDYFSSYNNLAFIYYQFFQEYDKAIPLLEKAIGLRPDYTEAYFNLAYCHHMLGEDENAKQIYLKAIELDSTFVQAYNYLGELYLSKNDTINAIAVNTKAIRIAPENDASYISLGKIYLSKGDTSVSMEYFEKAAHISPHNLDLLYNLAAFYHFKGNTEKADYYNNLINEQTP